MQKFERAHFEVKEYDESQHYGKFVFEPLERGFGTTIGNALRRVLLSSLPGAAVFSIKVDGVYHEFTSIPGIVEDVTAIGIGVPGSFDKKTCTLRFGTNLGLNNVSFADAFLPEFGCPVQLDNDANCAALGEATAGAAKGTRHYH